MVICKDCFLDNEIRSRIESHSVMGDCLTCGRHNVPVYDSNKDKYLDGIFDKVISLYTPKSLLPKDYPVAKQSLIKDELLNSWNIFQISDSKKVYGIIRELSTDIYSSKPELIDEPVANLRIDDQDYRRENSILGCDDWDTFVFSLKHRNRFHSNHFNTNILKIFCSYIRKTYKEGELFYRGRLSTKDGYPCEKMGAPPYNKATEGMANSGGISRLYLTNDPLTSLHEIRARAFDYVTIGTFRLKRDITIVDLKRIDKISPFLEDLDALQYAINKEHLNRINVEMSRPLRRNDSVLDYLPTQFVVDYIQSITHDGHAEYAGIEYKSTVYPSGYNLAIFYPDLFECTSVKIQKVNSISFDIQHIET